MRELTTNPSLRIAAIAFAIFVIVGTIAIFAFPDDEATPSDTSSGVQPTISIANQTRIAAFNATTLAGSPTPQAGSSIPPSPRPQSHQPPLELVLTGIPKLDATLSLLMSSSRYNVLDALGRADIACGTEAQPAAPCDGSPRGTTLAYFVAMGCGTKFMTDSATAQKFVAQVLDRHPAWDVGVVLREGIPGITTDGFAVGLRASAGNTGDLWYMDGAGQVIGLNAGCDGHGWGGTALDASQPGAQLLYCSDIGVICPTPQP